MDIEQEFRRIVDPPKPRRLIGPCPICHGKEWTDNSRTMGTCDTCHTPIPTAITRNAPPSRPDEDTGVRDTAAGLSKTLAKAEYDSRLQPYERGRDTDGWPPTPTANTPSRTQ